MCVCVATRLEGISVWVWGWEARDSLEGVESVGVCVWVGDSGVFRGC